MGRPRRATIEIRSDSDRDFAQFLFVDEELGAALDDLEPNAKTSEPEVTTMGHTRDDEALDWENQETLREYIQWLVLQSLIVVSVAVAVPLLVLLKIALVVYGLWGRLTSRIVPGGSPEADPE